MKDREAGGRVGKGGAGWDGIVVLHALKQDDDLDDPHKDGARFHGRGTGVEGIEGRRCQEKIGGGRLIVLDENGRVPTIVRNRSLDADIDVLTTRAFLEGMERRVPPPPGETYWDRVVTQEPTTNPRIQSFSQRRA